jgi:hypothetical protein
MATAPTQDFIVNAGLNVQGTATVTTSTGNLGALQVDGGAAVAQNLIVGTDAIVYGNLTVYGSIPSVDITTGTFTNLIVTGLSTLNAVTAGVTTASQLDVAARLAVGGLSQLNNATLSNLTNSTSSTTGALQVSGGVGIQKDLWVGGRVYVSGYEVVTTATVIASTLQAVSEQGSTTTVALTILNTSSSTSTTTGALVISGGLGVGGAINAESTSYIHGLKILTAGDLETVTTTATYITNDPALVAVSGTSTTYGTYNFGMVSDIWTFNDYNTGTNTGFYSINDASGAPGYIVYAGFSNITDFNRVVLNINYTQNSGHTVTVDLYNHQTLGWDSLTSYSGSVGWYQLALAIIDSAPYISSSTVTLRIYHASSGTPSHRTWIDYIALENSIQGGQGPRGATGATGAQGVQGLTTTTTSTFLFNNTTESISTNTGAVVVYGGVGVGRNLNVGGQLTVAGVTTFNDVVTFNGTATYVYSSNSVYTDSLIELHKNTVTSWTFNDHRDIGILGHYYDDFTSTATDFFLGFAVDERYLEFLVDGHESTPGHFSGKFGDLKLNTILLVSTATSTNSDSGALVVPGGVGVRGDINIQSTGKITVGIELQPTLLPNTPINTVGNVDSYLQVNNQNINTGTHASSDYILTADDGTDSNYYVDLGIANSGFSYPDFNISAPHDGYLFVQGGNLNIATGSPNKNIEFWVGGTATTSTGLTLPGTTVGKHVLTVNTTSLKVLVSTPATSTTTGALIVTGGVGISGDLHVGKQIVASAITATIITATHLNVIGSASIPGGLTATNFTTTELVVVGVATLNAFVAAIATVTNLTVAGLYDTGNMKVDGWFTASTATVYSLNVISNQASTSTTTGAVVVAGGVGVGGSIWAGNIYSNGAQVLTSAGGGGYVSAVTAGTDTVVSTSTGVILIWNNSTLQSITGRGASTTNAISITNTSSSTGTTTGALKVSGGVGVGGNVYVGNRVGFVNTAGNASAVYQFYNTLTNSLDTVFG